MREINIIAIDQRSKAYESYLEAYLNLKNVMFIEFKTMLANMEEDRGEIKQFPDLLVFTGGADVDPSLYGELKGSHTSINPDRDLICMKMFKVFRGIPKLGICRGSQFLTVAEGGKLIQHVENHTSNHTTTMLEPGRNRPTEVTVTSTHHQMLFPFNMDNKRFKILGWSTKHRSDVYLNGENKQIELPTDFVEPEVVYYPGGNSLAIQGHPEMAAAGGKFKEITAKFIKDLLI